MTNKTEDDKKPATVSTRIDKALADLESADENVRAEAAILLHEQSHPGALEACLKTLNDAPDQLHLDRTPAVRCLVEIGMEALEPLLDRLAAGDRMTRLHAQRAIEGITKRQFGFDGTTWAPGALDRWLAWWEQIAFDYDAEAAARAEGLARLRSWHREEALHR